MSRVPIRLRVTGAFVLVMALVLVATGVFVDARVRSERTRALDADLRSQVARGDAASVRGEDDELAQLLDARGRVLAASDEARDETGGAPLLSAADVRRLLARGGSDDDAGEADADVPSLTRETTVDGEPVRLLAQPTRGGGADAGGASAGGGGASAGGGGASAGTVLVAGRSLDDRDDQLAALRTTLVLGGLAALLLAAVAAYTAVAAALRPVERMRARAAAVSDEDPAARLPIPPARDEIRRLGETLNAMLDRLHGALERERRFVADASHELRTPLSILKAELELAARPGRTPDELRATVGSAAEESDRLGRLADDLLVLARAEGGRLPVRPQPVAADTLLRTVRDRFAARAAADRRAIEPPAQTCLVVRADPVRTEQALGNLVDNALRHGAGTVGLGAEARADARGQAVVRLVVRDEGTGFPPGFAASAFDRFTRGDQARGRGGAGLGLAIVAAIAAAHGGAAGADGAEAWIELPRAGVAEGS